MVHKKSTLFLVALAIAAAIPGAASSLFISNASFEMPVDSAGAFSLSAIPGWTSTGGNIITFNYIGATDPDYDAFKSVPDGVQAAEFGEGGGGDNQFLSQTLAATVAANTTYTLTFWIGNPGSTAGGFSGYTANLSANGVTLASDANVVSPTSGQFLEDTLTYIAGAAPAQLGDALTLTFGNNDTSGGSGLDNVQLNAVANSNPGVPEPGAWILVASGLGLLGIAKKRA